MKNLLAEKKLGFGQVALIAWMIFSILFVLFTLWNSGLRATYQLGEQAGVRGAIAQTIVEAQKGCEPFTVFSDNARVELINVACLQAPAEETEAAQ